MTTIQTDDLRILEIKKLISPQKLHNDIAISDQAAKTVQETRQQIHNILTGDDDRILVIIGPCSIHDTKAANEYAERLLPYKKKHEKDLLVVMRVYFEKPRTTVGWKGLINDPFLDNSFSINRGLHIARKLLVDLANKGMPAATEYLDLISPQYIADLISWGAIGARTTESQAHRELASGLSCPVGFKNGTDGGLQVAVDAIGAASRPHCFLSVTKEGQSAIFSTAGNQDCHVILRGGKQPNYDQASIDDASDALTKANLASKLMVDCSHANSRKMHERQIEVCEDVALQISRGENRIFGIMLESHLIAGKQDIAEGQTLTYGQSITDACINIDDGLKLLDTLALATQKRRAANLRDSK
jgi:3-deoxy-7-phosphoheptulonate synthase